MHKAKDCLGLVGHLNAILGRLGIAHSRRHPWVFVVIVILATLVSPQVPAASNKRHCLARGKNAQHLHDNGVGDYVRRYINEEQRACPRDTRNVAPLSMSLHALEQLCDLLAQLFVLGVKNPRLEHEVEALRVNFVGNDCC